MKPSADSLVLRRFGVRGLKVCAAVWYGLMCALLVCVAGRGMSVLAHLRENKPKADWHDSFVAYFTIALTVAAAAFLTRMFLRRRDEIRQLQSKAQGA